MVERRAAVLVLLAALGGGRAVAQVFPGDQARPPAFPAAYSVFLFGGAQANRATRIYNVGSPDPQDAACDSIDCRTVHGFAKAPGLGIRLQVPATPLTGLRVGLSYARPHRRVETRDGSEVLTTNEPVDLLRAELLVLFRLKRQAPVYFGVGGTAGHYSPGPVRTQNAAVEFGGTFVVGVDGRLSSKVGTRVEFTGMLIRPTAGGALTSEYHLRGLVFDGQVSVGVVLPLTKTK